MTKKAYNEYCNNYQLERRQLDLEYKIRRDLLARKSAFKRQLMKQIELDLYKLHIWLR